MNVLQELLSDELAIAVGFVGTPWAVHQVLSRTPQVRAIRQSLGQGGITEETIRRFVAQTLSDLRRGERFPDELALAALAVAIQTRPTHFAEEFLRDLSRLKLSEMSLCIRVARVCLAKRVALTRTIERKFDVGRTEEGKTTNDAPSSRAKEASFGSNLGIFAAGNVWKVSGCPSLSTSS